MRKLFKKFDTFHLIFIIFTVFFSFILILSIPSIFDYKKLQLSIEKQIESDFKFKMLNLSDIQYRFIPSPHLVIGNSDLILNNLEKGKIAELKNAKIYISLFQLYNLKNINIKKLKLSNENLSFNLESMKLFLEHLNSKNTKPVLIDKSKFFYLDDNENVTTIAQITKLRYDINNKTNQKKLKIKGKLFDTNFDFKWNKENYVNKNSNFFLKFSNPNITFENILELNNNKEKKGILKTNFLNNKLNLEYFYKNNGVELNTLDDSLNNFKISGKIEFKPFYFVLETNVKKQKINYLIKTILLNYFNLKNDIHPNLNGKLNVKLNKLENAYIKSGLINFNFTDSKINIENNELEIKNMGIIKMIDNLFYEDKGEVLFVADIELNIKNQDEFFRRFSIPIKNRKNLTKLYLTFEKNIDKDNYAISNFNLKKDPEFVFNEENINLSEKIYFNNYQKFRNIIKEEFIKIN